MAVLPRLEMRLVRGSPTGAEIGIVMRTTAVEVSPCLLGPAVLASWMCLAPFLFCQAAIAACARPGVERADPARGTDSPAGSAADGGSELDPSPPPSPDAMNVIRLPRRDRPR